jgi:hypothetical protein
MPALGKPDGPEAMASATPSARTHERHVEPPTGAVARVRPERLARRAARMCATGTPARPASPSAGAPFPHPGSTALRSLTLTPFSAYIGRETGSTGRCARRRRPLVHSCHVQSRCVSGTEVVAPAEDDLGTDPSGYATPTCGCRGVARPLWSLLSLPSSKGEPARSFLLPWLRTRRSRPTNGRGLR